MNNHIKTVTFIGIRGIPFTYSGFEEFAYQLGRTLAIHGWHVRAYCRRKYFPLHKSIHRNIKQIYLPTLYSPQLETFVHSFIATIHVCIHRNTSVVLYFGVGSTLWSFIPRLFGITTIVNVDGLDWKRKKWPLVGRLFLHASEYLATFLPSAIISDSLSIQQYYKNKYKKKSTYIPYYFEPSIYKPYTEEKNVMDKYSIKRNKYFLWVGRMVPDNNLEEVIKAFSLLDSNLKLVIVGDDLYNTSYKNQVLRKFQSNDAIVFTGFLSQQALIPLYKNARAYIESKRSNGTHPSLIEAMSLTEAIVSNDAEANKLILDSSAYYYKAGDPISLKYALTSILTKKALRDSKIKRKWMRTIIKRRYSSNEIIKQYEDFLLSSNKKAL